MRLQADDLALEPTEGARLVSLALLREAEARLEELVTSGRDEALHDFRVAVRRLRSLLRSLRPWLAERVPRKRERRLRELACATSGARDAEVQLAWLAGVREALSPRERSAATWLAGRLAEPSPGDPGAGTGTLALRFRRLALRLGRRLEARTGDEARGGGPTFGASLAEVVLAEARVLLEGLDALGGPQDVARAHATRIAAKRLRYLLEPLRGAGRADSRQAVEVLRELQDLLGELHDAHVLGAAIAARLEAQAVERSRRAHAAVLAGRTGGAVLRLASRDDLMGGLLLLDRRVAERAAAAFSSLLDDWLPSRRTALAREVEAVAEGLAPGAAGGIGAGRRFLLLHLPEEAMGLPPVELEEGWLPGPPPRTWLHRAAGPDGIRYFYGRGAGLDREEITEAQFAARWPLTSPRLFRRRRQVFVGPQRWVLDEVGERAIALAEITGPPGIDLRIPGWLRPLVVREVTDEKAFRGERLVTRSRRAGTGSPPATLGPTGSEPLDPMGQGNPGPRRIRSGPAAPPCDGAE